MRHLLLIVSFSVAPLSAHQKAVDPWQQYHNIAQATVNHVNKIPLPQIQKAGKNLVNVSKTLLTSFVSSNPQCDTYLNTALAAADKMQSLSLAQIEADYHEDGKLPPP